MAGFDTFVIVDWSAGNDRGPNPVRDAIWAGVNRQSRAQAPVYLRNRQIAEDWLTALFKAEAQAGRRVLVGFDFPFGYPTGFAQALTGSADPLRLWAWFADHVTDGPRANNRFDLAGKINQTLGRGAGPFWFNPLKRDIAGLARNKTGYRNPFPEKRHCEGLATGSFTCWQMGGAGAVGGQVMMGLPVLARLRAQFGAKVWPFEAVQDAQLAFVEVWPSLSVRPAPADMVKDAWQVNEVARQFSAQSPAALAKMLDVDAPEEGWILGLGHEARLRAAL